MQTKILARLAGLLYAIVGVTAPMGMLYVPGRLIESGNAHVTAQHIHDEGFLLNLGMASEIFDQLIEVYLVLVLYELLKSVHKPLARQMLVLGFLPIPIVLVSVLGEIAAQLLAGGAPYLSAIAPQEREALALLGMSLHGRGLLLAGFFWGLWLLPLGLLCIRSGFIPKIIGFSVIGACTGYVLQSTVNLLLPQYSESTQTLATILTVGEPPIILWLLIWGAKEDGRLVVSP